VPRPTPTSLRANTGWRSRLAKGTRTIGRCPIIPRRSASFRRLAAEIAGRRLRIVLAAQNSSNTIDFFRLTQSNAFSDFKDFDGQSLPSLVHQQDQLKQHIALNFNSRDILKRVSSNAIRRGLGNIDLMIEGWSSVTQVGEASLSVTQVSEASLKEFQAATLSVWAGINGTLGMETTADIRPDCSPPRLIFRLFAGDDRTSVEVPNDEATRMGRYFIERFP
jgi:hypothetical protein